MPLIQQLQMNRHADVPFQNARPLSFWIKNGGQAEKELLFGDKCVMIGI